MAKIIGNSGCTDFLLNKLHRVRLREINSIDEIRKIVENFSGLLNKITNKEKESLSLDIEVLKKEEMKLLGELNEKVSERRSQLLAEKKEIPTLIEKYSNISKNLFIKLLNKIKILRLKRRLKNLGRNLDKLIEKPFRKIKKRIKKIQKLYGTLEKNYDSIIEKRTSYLHKSRKIVNKNIQVYYGAVGEEAVIRELKFLPDSYSVFNDVNLSFSRSIRWKKYNEYVKSCQIDHVVVGPSGIFLIETKNWSARTLRTAQFTPPHQIERAGYIFYIKTINLFGKKMPIHNIVVTLGKVPTYKHQYVQQLSVKELTIPSNIFYPNVEEKYRIIPYFILIN